MKIPKILLLGKDGQVGWELQRTLAPVGELIALGRSEADLENVDSLKEIIARMAPDIVINAAAYTAVDKAESEPEKARLINSEAVGAMAAATELLGAWLIHYSTDYVFDGKKNAPYVETDVPSPLSVYGQSKLEGELALQTLNPSRHLILRTCWVYAARGKNFMNTILRLAGEREELRIVADQHGAPTSATLIADTTARLVSQILHNTEAVKLAGIYNLAASGETSWHEFACRIVEWAREAGMTLKANKITPIPCSDYPTPAARPYNSRLDTHKLQKAFSLVLPDWQEQARRDVRSIVAGL